MSMYTVVHGRRSLQLATNRLVIPADEVPVFTQAAQCAHALTTLLEQEGERIEVAVKNAHQLGFEQGQKQGAQAAQDAVSETLANMAKELQAQHLATRESVKVLALAVVYKLAAALGAAEVVPTLIEQAVAELLPAKTTRIRVNAQALEPTRARLLHMGVEAEVRVDENLTPFDCVIESSHGQNVVSLDTQLNAISNALGVKPALDLEIV
jgi:flagellar biosynthesis/type III secretory pathway protein FliH